MKFHGMRPLRLAAGGLLLMALPAGLMGFTTSDPNILRIKFPGMPPVPADCLDDFSFPNFATEPERWSMLFLRSYPINADTEWRGYDKVIIEGMAAEEFGFDASNSYDNGNESCADLENDWNNYKVPDTATVTIGNGATLTIQEGITVEFAGGYGLTVSSGRLQVNGSGENPVTFKGNQWSGLQFNAGTQAELNHCKITGSSGANEDDPRAGVRIFSSDVVLDNCLVDGNEAFYGGGIYSFNASPTIRDSQISNNDGFRGGGLYIIGGSPTLLRTSIVGNKDSQIGGGLFITGGSTALIANSVIAENTAVGGGGLYVANSAPRLVNSVIVSNETTSAGGGLLVDGTGTTALLNSVVARNLSHEGGGLYLNTDGATVNARNSIIWGNTVEGRDPRGPQLFLLTAANAASFRNSIVEGGLGGFHGSTGSIDFVANADADPLFNGAPQQSGADGGGSKADWTLAQNSPGVNAGVNADFPADAVLLAGSGDALDLAGNVRVFPGNANQIDLGAYEFPNNPPILTDTSLITVSLSEDALPRVLELCTEAVDVDVHEAGLTSTLVGWLATLPREGYGEIAQYEDGEPGDTISSDGTVIADPERRVYYTPAGRSRGYTAELVCQVKDVISQDGEELTERSMLSRETQTVRLQVAANNDPPSISSVAVTRAQAGKAYEYQIEVEDPDADQPTGDLRLSVVRKPTWLTLEFPDGEKPRLAGTPAEAGEAEVTLRVSDPDGAFGEQAFTITVDAAPQAQVEVDAGGDASASPGQEITLSGSGPDPASYTYRWVISDADGVEVASFDGDSFVWSTDTAGSYTAVLTVTDDNGNEVSSDRISLSVAEGFDEVEDGAREAPSEDEAALMDSIDAARAARVAGTDWSALTTAERIDALQLMAQRLLTPAQRSALLTGVADVLAGADPLDEVALNTLLGALDNLVQEAAASDGPADAVLTAAQIDQFIANGTALLARAGDDLTLLQLSKAAEVYNEVLVQRANADLSAGQIAAYDVLAGQLAGAAVEGGLAVNAVGGASLKLASLVVAADSSVAVTLGDELNPAGPKVLFNADSLDELRAAVGGGELRLALVLHPLTQGNGWLLRLTGRGPGDASLDELALGSPLLITLPVVDPARATPAAVGGAAMAVSTVSADDTAVVFNAGGISRYTLVSAAGGGSGGSSDGDKAGSTAGSCFGSSLSD